MRKKHIISFGLLLTTLAAVGSIASTTAWFIGTSIVKVSAIDVSIGTKRITISDDGMDFKDHLTKDDLLKVDYFKPCTSAFSYKWLDAHAQMPDLRTAYNRDENPKQFLTDDQPLAEDNKGEGGIGYFAQELYMKTDSEGYILIDPDNTWVEPDVQYNTAIGKTPEKIEELNNIAKSLRIAVLTLGYYDNQLNLLPNPYDYGFTIIDCYKYKNYGLPNQTYKDVYLGGVMDIDGDTVFDYNRESNCETLYGEINGIDVTDPLINDKIYDEITDINTPYVLDPKGEPTWCNASHKGSVRAFNREKAEANGIVVSKEKSVAVQDLDSHAFAMHMYGGIKRKFVLCFYLEGWDQENTNLTMHAGFKVQVNFMFQDGISR